jgi:hypothetical protein
LERVLELLESSRPTANKRLTLTDDMEGIEL